MSINFLLLLLLNGYALCAGVVLEFRNTLDIKKEIATVYYVSQYDCQAYIQHVDKIKVDTNSLNVFLFENVRSAEMNYYKNQLLGVPHVKLIFSTVFAESFIQCFQLQRNSSFYFRINENEEVENFTMGLPLY